MNNKKLLLKLIKAYDEKEVESIISSQPVLSKDKNWKPYGGFRGNLVKYIINNVMRFLR